MPKIETKYGYCFYDISQEEGACMFDLFVLPEYRRLGHGRELIRMGISGIRDKGYVGPIGIEARPKEGSIPLNDLIEFYRKEGLYVTNG